MPLGAAKVSDRFQAAGAAFRAKLINRIHVDAEYVAVAALGADVLRLGRIRLDLAPEPHDLDVDGAVVDFVVVQPRKVQQLVPVEDAMRSAEKHHEQAELALAEHGDLAAGSGEPARLEVELPAVEAVGAAALG